MPRTTRGSGISCSGRARFVAPRVVSRLHGQTLTIAPFSDKHPANMHQSGTAARIALAVTTGFVTACSWQADVPANTGVNSSSPAVLRRSPPHLRPAQFRITRVGPPEDTRRRYMATTDDPAPACKFEVIVEHSRRTSDAPFSIAGIALRRQPGSDCTALLSRVSKQLDYSGSLPNPALADEVSGAIAIFAAGQSRTEGPDGTATYSSTPAGGWLDGKLFVAEGEGEVFLAMSERDGIAEFSIKDQDYAPIVVTELARIFLPRGAE